MKALKNKYRITTKRIAVLCVLALAIAGCKKNFIVPDHDGIDNERLWDDAGAVNLFLNGTYWSIMPDFPYEQKVFYQEYASDENIGSGTDGTMKKVLGIGGYLQSNDVQIIGKKYQNGSKGDNKYFEIARCNLGIYNVAAGTLPEATKKPIIGQFYMLRAMDYFDLVRLYGGVPLVLKPQDPTNVDYSGRKSAKQCFDTILSDLDSAAANLDVIMPGAEDWGRLGKLAAICYKGRVALTWASPQFNPVNDGVHPYDATRWGKALKANEDAYNMCLTSGLKLMKYADIFTTKGPANTEAIIVKEYSNQLAKRYNGVEAMSRPGGPITGGSPSDLYVASQRMLDAYPMADGTPITATGSGYDPDMYFLNRDPRFAATIAYNGSPWKLSGISNRIQWSYPAEIDGAGGKVFYCKRFANPTLAASAVGITNDIGGGGLDWIELRFAEVLLNYAECLNETGSLDKSKDLVRQLRQARGLVAGANDYGLNFAANTDQMRDLIMNERMVEFAFEGKRGWDLRRTRRLDKLSGFLTVAGEQIYPVNTKDPLYIQKKATLEEIVPGTTQRRRDTLQVTKRSSYRYYFERSLVVGDTKNAISIPADQCYFYALPNQFLLSSPTLDQTIGWDNGTFDPLKN